MKSSFIALFFIFAFTASSIEAQLVLDVDGDPLTNGGSYYILPHVWPIGTGMVLGKTGNETCPLSVKSCSTHSINTEYGLPWKIASLLKIRFLPENSNVDFFSVEEIVSNCVRSPSKWTIVEEDDGIKSVKISGYENTIKGVFKIQQYTTISYKIVFCPADGDSCGDIGLFSSRGLGITNQPLGLVFFKVESSKVPKQVIKSVLEA